MEPVRLQLNSPPTDLCRKCHGSGGGRTAFGSVEYCDCPRGAEVKAIHRENRIEDRIAQSNIPVRLIGLGIDDFPVTPASQKALAAVQAWLDGEGNDGLFIHGEYGVGKTGIVAAVLKTLMEHDRDGYFIPVPDLLDSIRATYGEHATEDDHKLLRRVKDVELLVLDDIGAERPSDWVVEKLFTIINRRHSEMLPTFFTSNLSIPQLAERLGERITWRIVEMCDVVHLKGPNLRAKQ